MFLYKLIDALDRHQVRFAIAGGVAVALHGAVRGTFDVDLVVTLSEENLIAAEKALNGLGLKSRLPLKAAEVAQFRTDYIEKRNLIAWTFVNPVKPTEVVDILLIENLSSMTIKKIPLSGRSVPVLSKKSLIEMKRRSNRKQDLLDIQALEGDAE